MAANMPENNTPSKIENANSLYAKVLFLSVHFNIHLDIFSKDFISLIELNNNFFYSSFSIN